MDARVTRRRFVTLALFSFAGTVLVAACGSAAPQPPTTAPQPTAAPAAPTAAPAPPTAAPAAPTTAPTAAAAAPTAVPTTAPAAAAPTAAVAGAEKGTLNFAAGAFGGQFIKPVLLYSYSSERPALLTHSRLVSLDGMGKLNPDLADKWDLSSDGTKYTYNLRKDVKFHDGVPVTARDVEATARLYLTKAANINPSFWTNYIKGGKEFYDGTSNELPGVQVKDDFTITFELKEPYSNWDQVALAEMNVLPAHIYKGINPADLKEDDGPAWFKPENQIGSGPFKFVRAEKEKFVELARNDDYFGGKPKLDKIFWRNLGKSDTEYIAFEKGEVDVWNVPFDYADRVKKLTNATLNEIRRRYIRIFLVNHRAPYLADKRIRQAILYGIDRKSLVDQIYNGLAVPYNSFVEAENYVAEGLNQYEYNPDKAKQLLKDANYDSSKDLRLLYYYNDTIHKDMFAAVQQQLSKIGVKVTPQLVEGAALTPKTKNGEYDLLYQGWGFQGVPSVYGPLFTCERGYEGYACDPKVEELFKKGQTATSASAQKDAYDEIQKIINDTLPIYPFLKFKGLVAINKRVTGFGDDAIWMMYHPWYTGHNGAVNWAVQ